MMSHLWESLFPPKPKMLVLVHHESMNDSIEGILVATSKNHYVLDVAKLHSNARTTPVAIGKVMIPKDKVTFLQVLDEGMRF